MKLNLTNGYLISPYIIWGELDYRGYVAIGFELERPISDFSLLKNISGRKQYIQRQNRKYLFVSIPLATFAPEESIFNLPDDQLQAFYKKTYEGAQDEILSIFYRVQKLLNQKISTLSETELFDLWQSHFTPIQHDFDISLFNPSKSILTNCLPEQRLKENNMGFELNGCIHHFIRIHQYPNFKIILNSLSDHHLIINHRKCSTEVYVHLFGLNLSEVNCQASFIKSSIQDIPKADYYEANDAKENLKIFEHCVPGWIFAHKPEIEELQR